MVIIVIHQMVVQYSIYIHQIDMHIRRKYNIYYDASDYAFLDVYTPKVEQSKTKQRI